MNLYAVRPSTCHASRALPRVRFSVMFDGMTALSTKYNDTPETASRAFDVSRDGFVIAGELLLLL